MQPTDIDQCSNTAQLFMAHAHTHPKQFALVKPSGEALTYEMLEEDVAKMQAALFEAGLREGHRVLVLLPVDFDFYRLMLALFSSAIVVVFIDPGMGLKKLLSTIDDIEVDAVVSVDKFLRVRWISSSLRGVKLYSLTSSGIGKIKLCPVEYESNLAIFDRPDDAPSLVSFTSGTSGKAKGSHRTQRLLKAQMKALLNHSELGTDGIHLTSFPVAVLHSIAVGESVVIPDMDLACQQALKPGKIIEQIERSSVNRLSVAPFFMEKLCQWLQANPTDLTKMESLREVIVGGAPVYKRLAMSMSLLFPQAKSFVVYGSTEAEPISKIDITRLLKKKGRGYCIGHEVDEISLELAILPESIPEEGLTGGVSEYLAPDGVPGEIIVSGEHVLKTHHNHEEANRRTKIRDGGTFWHRTGDLAVRDDEGDLWLMGRRGESIFWRGETFYPFVIESLLNEHPCVVHSAVVQLAKDTRPIVAVVFKGYDLEKARAEWVELLKTVGVSQFHIQLIESMPMDARHQSKVLRSDLRGLCYATDVEMV